MVLFIPGVKADEEIIEKELTQVKLVNCMSANTQLVENVNTHEYMNIRLIAFDLSVENTSEVDKYVCNILKNANKLEIELDNTEKDQYNRTLVWLYVNDELLQNKLISEGYGQVNFVTGEFKYIQELCEAQKNAIINRSGIWSNGETKELYCESGIDLKETKKEEKKEEVKEEKKDVSYLWYMVFISSGILLMLITFMMVRKNEKKR